METITRLRAKARRLRAECARVPNLRLDIESPRQAYLSTLLCRGDRRLSRFLEAANNRRGDWWQTVRSWQDHGIEGLPHPDEYVHRQYGESEIFPWDFIDHGINKRYLWIERRKGLSGRQTAPCDPSTCTACAAC